FAGVATALAAIGVYGVIAGFVGQRPPEFGIRRGLGAQRRDVLQFVLRPRAKMILTGTVIGVAAAIALTRLLARVLYGIAATEPISYAAGVAILLLSGFVACYVPARRAMQVDPAQSLRSD